MVDRAEVDIVAEDWQTYRGARRVSYRGEGVKEPVRRNWPQVRACLSPQSLGGHMSARDLSEGPVKDFWKKLEGLERPLEALPHRPRPGKFFVNKEGLRDLAVGLVKYNICTILNRPDILHVGVTPLLNRAFGLDKPAHAGVVLEGLA